MFNNKFFYVFLFMLVGLTLSFKSQAADFEFEVNSTSDDSDNNLGDGNCDTDGSGTCTLRAAIEETNYQDPCDDVLITFNSSVTNQTICIASQLEITHSVTIQAEDGGEVTVDGGNGSTSYATCSASPSSERIFAIDATTTVECTETSVDIDVTIDTDTTYTGTDVSASFESLDDLSTETTTTSESEEAPILTVSMNYLIIKGGSYLGTDGGGGIYAYGTALDLNYATITENESIGPASMGDGDGGGMYIQYSTVNLTNTTVSDNTAMGDTMSVGGGMVVAYSTITIANSTISNNTINDTFTAHGVGMKIYSTTLNMINSTVSGNTADAPSYGGEARGGGIYVSTSCVVNISNSTISNNAISGGYDYSGEGSGGGIYNESWTSTVNIKSTILSGNQAIANSSTGDGPDCYTAYGPILNSYGYNLVEDTTDCTLDYSASGVSSSTDITGVDPQLSSLANNGGDTQTHALGRTSQARNAGSCDSLVDGTITTDQRGYSRVSTCDIGSYEWRFTITRPNRPLVLVHTF